MPPLKVAAVQMDGAIAPRALRLKRAATQIAAAAKEGAQLVVLPECFNTGISYLETQYEASESLKGETLSWLSEQAKKHKVHIAGSLLLLDTDDCYNRAFLVAPDGKSWTYDKNFPFLWERVLFRDGRGITVADTSLGKIGFLIGWDAAHADLFERYAAKVDVLLILHSAQDLQQIRLRFPDGSSLSDLGSFPRWFSHATKDYLGKSLVNQAQWLNMPMVIAGASGTFSSLLPAPYFSMNALLATKPRWRAKAEDSYGEIIFEAPFQQNTRIISANGETLSFVETQGDSFALADLELAERPPLPVDGMEQPRMGIPLMAYLLTDVVATAPLILTYKRGLRRQWGEAMAKTDSSTKRWFAVLFLGMLFASLLTRFSRRK